MKTLNLTLLFAYSLLFFACNTQRVATVQDVKVVTDTIVTVDTFQYFQFETRFDTVFTDNDTIFQVIEKTDTIVKEFYNKSIKVVHDTVPILQRVKVKDLKKINELSADKKGLSKELKEKEKEIKQLKKDVQFLKKENNNLRKSGFPDWAYVLIFAIAGYTVRHFTKNK